MFFYFKRNEFHVFILHVSRISLDVSHHPCCSWVLKCTRTSQSCTLQHSPRLTYPINLSWDISHPSCYCWVPGLNVLSVSGISWFPGHVSFLSYPETSSQVPGLCDIFSRCGTHRISQPWSKFKVQSKSILEKVFLINGHCCHQSVIGYIVLRYTDIKTLWSLSWIFYQWLF